MHSNRSTFFHWKCANKKSTQKLLLQNIMGTINHAIWDALHVLTWISNNQPNLPIQISNIRVHNWLLRIFAGNCWNVYCLFYAPFFPFIQQLIKNKWNTLHFEQCVCKSTATFLTLKCWRVSGALTVHIFFGFGSWTYLNPSLTYVITINQQQQQQPHHASANIQPAAIVARFKLHFGCDTYRERQTHTGRESNKVNDGDGDEDEDRDLDWL